MDVRAVELGGAVQITLDLRDLEDILQDLRYVDAVEPDGLEPRTQDLVDLLAEKGIKW